MPKRSNRGTNGAKNPSVEKKLPGWLRNIARRARAMIEQGKKVFLLIKNKTRVGLSCKANEVVNAIRKISRQYSTTAIQIAAV